MSLALHAGNTSGLSPCLGSMLQYVLDKEVERLLLCYNMSWTRKLKDCCYDKPMVMLGFEVKTSTASKPDFTYYLCVQQVRTTRCTVPCYRKDAALCINLPLRFESSIALFGSHYEHVATCWQCEVLGTLWQF